MRWEHDGSSCQIFLRAFNNGNLSHSKIWCRLLYVRLGNRYVSYVALLLVVVGTPYAVCKIASCITRWKGKIQPSCFLLHVPDYDQLLWKGALAARRRCQ